MRFAVYTFDGAIVRILDCPLSQLSYNLAPDEGAEVCGPEVADDTHWVDGLVGIRLRDDYTLESLPIPCTITVEGVVYECNEQPTFVFDAPGIYTISVDAGPAYYLRDFTYDYQP